MSDVKILQGDCRQVLPTLPSESVDCVVTSPPYYFQRDYGVAGQIGLESVPICPARKSGQQQQLLTPRDDLTPAQTQRMEQLLEELKGLADFRASQPCGECYVCRMVEVFREVRRVLKPQGTLWLNLGDSSAYDNKWGGRSSGKNLYKQYGRHAGKHAYAAGTPGGFPANRKRRVTGLPTKSLLGIPWRVAFALQDDGWILRSDIVWAKPCPMPESVKDRPTRSHEFLFLFSKRPAHYHYDHAAIAEPAVWPGVKKFLGGQKGVAYEPTGPDDPNYRNGTDQWGREIEVQATRNRRDVWTVAPEPFRGSHMAVMPSKLVEPCILAGCPADGVVLDPFGGTGTVGRVAVQQGRNAILIELNPEYVGLMSNRTDTIQQQLGLAVPTQPYQVRSSSTSIPTTINLVGSAAAVATKEETQQVFAFDLEQVG